MEWKISFQKRYFKIIMCVDTVKIPVVNRKWFWSDLRLGPGFSSMSPLSLVIMIQSQVWWTETPIILKYRIFLEKLQIPTMSEKNRETNFQLDETLIKCQNVRIISLTANVKVLQLWYILLKLSSLNCYLKTTSIKHPHCPSTLNQIRQYH